MSVHFPILHVVLLVVENRIAKGGVDYFGTYTVTGDQYDLAGFGTVLVNGGASGTVSLQIQTNGGPSVTVAAQRRQQYSAIEVYDD